MNASLNDLPGCGALYQLTRTKFALNHPAPLEKAASNIPPLIKLKLNMLPCSSRNESTLFVMVALGCCFFH
jgi:hypothetical protein